MINWNWAPTAIVLLFAFASANAETAWPQFRGPDGQGYSDATGFGKANEWQVLLIPLYADSRIYLCSQEGRTVLAPLVMRIKRLPKMISTGS